MVRYQEIRQILGFSLISLLLLAGCSTPKQSGVALYVPERSYKILADTMLVAEQEKFFDLSDNVKKEVPIITDTVIVSADISTVETNDSITDLVEKTETVSVEAPVDTVVVEKTPTQSLTDVVVEQTVEKAIELSEEEKTDDLETDAIALKTDTVVLPTKSDTINISLAKPDSTAIPAAKISETNIISVEEFEQQKTDSLFYKEQAQIATKLLEKTDTLVSKQEIIPIEESILITDSAKKIETVGVEAVVDTIVAEKIQTPSQKITTQVREEIDEVYKEDKAVALVDSVVLPTKLDTTNIVHAIPERITIPVDKPIHITVSDKKTEVVVDTAVIEKTPIQTPPKELVAQVKEEIDDIYKEDKTVALTPEKVALKADTVVLPSKKETTDIVHAEPERMVPLEKAIHIADSDKKTETVGVEIVVDSVIIEKTPTQTPPKELATQVREEIDDIFKEDKTVALTPEKVALKADTVVLQSKKETSDIVQAEPERKIVPLEKAIHIADSDKKTETTEVEVVVDSVVIEKTPTQTSPQELATQVKEEIDDIYKEDKTVALTPEKVTLKADTVVLPTRKEATNIVPAKPERETALVETTQKPDENHIKELEQQKRTDLLYQQQAANRVFEKTDTIVKTITVEQIDTVYKTIEIEKQDTIYRNIEVKRVAQIVEKPVTSTYQQNQVRQSYQDTERQVQTAVSNQVPVETSQINSELMIKDISGKLDTLTNLLLTDSTKHVEVLRDTVFQDRLLQDTVIIVDTIFNTQLMENPELEAEVISLQDSIALLQSYLDLKDKALDSLEGKIIIPKKLDSICYTAYYNPGKIISTKEKAILSELKEKIAGKKVHKVSLLGFTDRSGSPELNLRLSNQRVVRWVNELITLGIDRELIFMQYFGAEYASEKVVENERRVEIIVEVEVEVEE